MTEAVESHIGGWFWNAAARSRLRPVATPEYDFELPANESEPWSFSATVEVQPTPEIVDWTTLEVPRAEAEVPAGARRAGARGAARVGRRARRPSRTGPAARGDIVVVDLVEPDGEAQRDTVVELGAGRLVDEIERALVGRRRARRRSVELRARADGSTSANVDGHGQGDQGEGAAAARRRARARRERVRHARRAARRHRGRLREQLDAEIEAAFRAAAVDDARRGLERAAGGPARRDARARELLNGFVRSLERRGISPETYLAARPARRRGARRSDPREAALSVARELVLEAVADKLGIEVSDDEVEGAHPRAGRGGRRGRPTR